MDTRTSQAELNGLLLTIMHIINDHAFQMFGNTVKGGPFEGMIIPSRSPWDDGNSGVKLMGVYEHELHTTVESIIWRQPKLIVNVGCAEGYYAIGFARRLRIPTYAFDLEMASLKCCEDYAIKNGVDRLNLARGASAPSELRLCSEPQGHRFYLFDVEGSELDLINLELCPELVKSDILVECHDFLDPLTSRKIADRLASTHRVERILPALPDFTQFQMLRHYPNVLSVLLVAEKRPMPCCWLMCWANQRGD